MSNEELFGILLSAQVPFKFDGKGNYTFGINGLSTLLGSVQKATIEICEEDKPANEPVEAPKVVKSEEPKKAEPIEDKKKIDKGKVRALHEAGWANNEIVREMGCAPCTISNILAKRF